MNTWNNFRKDHKGQGLTINEMSRLYREKYPIFRSECNKLGYDGCNTKDNCVSVKGTSYKLKSGKNVNRKPYCRTGRKK